MFDLSGKVAIVTGGSRGIGRGIALSLGEAGAIVYVTGRTIAEGQQQEGLPGTIYETAETIIAKGGQAIAVACDHRLDENVSALFQRVKDEQGQLDILVNNVWGGYEYIVEATGEYSWENPFWQQPIRRWDGMFAGGVRAHFVASRFAAGMMVQQQQGLIVNISYWAGQKYMNNVMYGVSKAATDRLAQDIAHELQEFGVTAVSLYPGLVRTERVMGAAEFFDMSNSESPQFTGLAIAALAADPHVLDKSGQILVAAQVALDYGFTDIDGKEIRPLTLATS